MAPASTLRLNTREVTQSLTIKVTGLKGLRLRLRIAALIFRLGASVAGTKIEMDMADSQAKTLEVLPESEWQMDRRAGCIYVSTHGERSGSVLWRTWQRLKYPD